MGKTMLRTLRLNYKKFMCNRMLERRLLEDTVNSTVSEKVIDHSTDPCIIDA